MPYIIAAKRTAGSVGLDPASGKSRITAGACAGRFESWGRDDWVSGGIDFSVSIDGLPGGGLMKKLKILISGKTLLVSNLFTAAMFIVPIAWGADALSAAAEQPVAAGAAAAPVDAWGDMIRAGVTGGDGVYESRATDIDVDLFFTVWGNNTSLMFVNPRARFSDEHGSNEYNFGLGYRSLVHDARAILGVNVFYDTMRSVNRKRYHQFGLGLEAISKWLDFRSNVYLPFGTTQYEISRWSDLDHTYTRMEEAPEGFDAELGFMVPIVSDVMETHAYFGGFWYGSNFTDDLTGWNARLELRPVRMLILGYEHRADSNDNEDDFFSGTLEIPFSLTAIGEGRNPFGGFKDAMQLGAGPRDIRERMTEKVTRDRNIVTVDVVLEEIRERCGNGRIETNEQCDDGNTVGRDGCSSTCQKERADCGNGIVESWAGEPCDDGNQVTEACTYGLTRCRVCSSHCSWADGAVSVCGDGIVNGPETCDDGNTNNGDGCNSGCFWEAAPVTPVAVCGNGTVETGETCDRGAGNGCFNPPYDCSDACQSCDGFLE